MNGWEVSDSSTVDDFDCLTKVLALMLVGEHYGDSSSTILGNGDNDGDNGGGRVSDALHSAPGRQSKSGRKSRKNTNRDGESSLER